MHPILLIFLLFMWVSIASPALASDGILEINQACATQSGCFTGDAPGFPVIISQAGSYQLTSNLSEQDRSRSLIRLTTSDVSIDLRGFVMSYPSTGAGQAIGIDGGSANRSSVRNGVLKNAGGDCVSLGNRGRVEEMVISGCGQRGISLAGGAIIRDNQVEDTGFEGIAAQGSPMVIDNFVIRAGRTQAAEGIEVGVAALIRGNVVRLGSGVGIRVGQRSNVEGNVIDSNVGNGISADAHSLIRSNTAVANSGTGIRFDPYPGGSGVTSGLVVHNVTNDNFIGIYAAGLLLGNLSHSNTSFGILSGAVAAGNNSMNENNSGGDQVSASFSEVSENECGYDLTCP